MNGQLIFDASSILILLKLLGEEALDALRSGSTISLAYYEVGNGIWRECLLLKRIGLKEALKVLKTVFGILQKMNVVSLEGEEVGEPILDLAVKLGITYYDASYLTEALRTGKTLVTDDEKLSEAAKLVGVKTLTSKDLAKISHN
ncbi:MAG: type II toxin-antitoxin system VapC family toxin [Candidatus Bathyarchaeia archaeon]